MSTTHTLGPMEELIAMRALDEITVDEFRLAAEMLKAEQASGSLPVRQQYALQSRPQQNFLARKRFWFCLMIVAYIAVVSFRPTSQQTAGDHRTAPVTSQPYRQLVHALQYGSDWPFPFAEGKVGCTAEKFGDTERPLVTLSNGPAEYALNGVARATGRYLDYQTLMSSDPSTGAFDKGAKTVDDLIRLGVALCP